MVLGFALTFDLRDVLLVEKNRPKWQAGMINGVGGHIEENEDAIDAMEREFQEEIGQKVTEWRQFCSMAGKEWVVHCFVAETSFTHDQMNGWCELVLPEHGEIAAVRLCPVNWLPHNTLWNLRWLIPMALDKDLRLGPPVTVAYR